MSKKWRVRFWSAVVAFIAIVIYNLITNVAY